MRRIRSCSGKKAALMRRSRLSHNALPRRVWNGDGITAPWSASHTPAHGRCSELTSRDVARSTLTFPAGDLRPPPASRRPVTYHPRSIGGAANFSAQTIVLPAEVSTAPPNGIGPCFRSSLKGPVPPRRLIAPDTRCGSSSHHGMMLRFQALTITSTSNVFSTITRCSRLHSVPWRSRGQRWSEGSKRLRWAIEWRLEFETPAAPKLREGVRWQFQDSCY